MNIKNKSPQTSVKFVLMNTAGNRNRDLDEPFSFGERIVMGMVRLLIPPQQDNEKARGGGWPGFFFTSLGFVLVPLGSVILSEKN